MVNSLSPSEPTVGPSSGPATTANTFGNLNFDPSPLGSTSAPSSLRGPTSGSSSGGHSSSGNNSVVTRLPQPMEGNKSGSDSDSCSECEDENCDCDASWIELSADVPSIDVNQITEKIDNMLTSLSKIDTSTSVGPSLNPGLVDLEQQLITLREDNLRLLSVLEATNEAMKKNLTYAQELKGELKSSHSEYDSLKSSADTAIDQLRADNERLRRRVSELETEQQDRNNEPVAYHQFDVPKEMNMQEMTSQIASRDIRISQLMGEINNLTAQLERTRFDLSRSTSQQSMNSAHQSHQQHQQLMAFPGNQPQTSAPSFSSMGDQSNRSNVDENTPNPPANTPTANPGFLQSVLGEMGNLKAMVDLLRGQKQTLESRLAGRRHRSGHRHSHRHQPPTMGTSYSANTAQDPNPEQSSDQPGNMESDPSDPQYHHHHGRHRRHHRHHASKALRRLEKKMARTSLPVVNSAIMFKGFTTYSNQPQ